MKPREGLLLMIQWFYVAKISSAAKTSCVNEYCFTSSIPLALNQGDALNWCQTNASKLIEVTNSSVQSAMSSALGATANEFRYYPFTGGKRVSQPWSWINGKGTGSLTFGDLYDVSYAYGYLIRQTSVTLWARRPADTRQGYICQGESMCSRANDAFTLSSSCYRSYVEALSWYNARNRCLVNGGDLATFDSITTNGDLSIINGTWLQRDVTYWIGVRRETWKWQTSDVTYSNWMSDHPITYIDNPLDCLCVIPQRNWQWTECRCSEQHPFICISPSAVTSSTTTTSTTTTTKPTTTTTTMMMMQMTDNTSYDRPEDIQLHPTDAIYSSTEVLTTKLSSSHNSQSPQTQDSFDIRVAIGIGVGVGAGIVVMAVIVVVIVIVIRKCPPKRKQKQKQQLQPPDLIALQTTGNKAMEESPYGTVIKQPGIGGESTVDDGDMDSTPNTIYADLQFLPQTSFKDPRNEPMNLVNEISEPTESLSQTTTEAETEAERKRTERSGTLKDTVTRA